MFDFVDHTLSCFIGSIISILTISAFCSERTHQVDVTARVRDRLSSAVAGELTNSRVPVVRERWQGRMAFAYTRLIFPRTMIVIDYNEDTIDPTLENFIIAHELAHVRGRHLIVMSLLEALYAGWVVALALQFSLNISPLISSLTIGLSIIAVGTLLAFPLLKAIAIANEFSADRFAAKFVGTSKARECLEALKETVHASYRSDRNNLDARIKRLRAREVIARAAGTAS